MPEELSWIKDFGRFDLNEKNYDNETLEIIDRLRVLFDEVHAYAKDEGINPLYNSSYFGYRIRIDNNGYDFGYCQSFIFFVQKELDETLEYIDLNQMYSNSTNNIQVR